MSQAFADYLVARGAKVWDEKLPSTWFWDVDPEELQMDNVCKCVGGQIAGKKVNLDALGWHGLRENANRANYWTTVDLLRNNTEFSSGESLGMNQVATSVYYAKKYYQIDISLDRMIESHDRVKASYEELTIAWKREIYARRAAVTV